METVVLHSDIARLVLGYLKRQSLERASRLFCKSSPHLRQEFWAYKKGFMAHSFFPELEEIICEYVNITNTVNQLLTQLPSSMRTQLQGAKLSKQVKDLLERALQALTLPDNGESMSQTKRACNANSLASTSFQSDKENSAKKHSKCKRKRLSLVYSSDEHKDRTSSAHKNSVKRRRVLEPFCYLSVEQQRKQRACNSTNASTTGEEQSQSDDENDLESADEDDDDDTENECTKSPLDNDTDLSLLEKPTKESTPRIKQAKSQFQPPTVPEISQAILDNPTFQLKLVENINQALHNSNQYDLPAAATAKCVKPVSNENGDNLQLPCDLSDEQQIISSNQMLDQMVKEILAATEKDPIFDAIVKEVVDASMQQPSSACAGVQCNMAEPATEYTAASTLVQQHIDASVSLAQQQQLSIPCTAQQLSDMLSVAPIPPRTPLIIRTAVAAANASLNGEHQVIPTLTGNNSFGSLIDPNFSISKLIVLNSNDSAQKHPPSDQIIGNTTADQLMSQLANGADAPMDDQVFFDANTGQLTIPLLLTDEGLLANFPFLINNETVTQQLQPDNIMDCSRIEIPLPEPIIVTADQFPPNSIIVTSAQKAITEEEQQQNLQKQQQTVCKKPKDTKLPSSLDIRSSVDRATPSSSGIVNIKAFRSLSTPRKRTSHVRTLTFSPRPGGCPARISTRRESQKAAERASKEAALVSEKPIIKDVQILPRLASKTAAEMSANESSNSCSAPFANEESSNQTVIKGELSLKEVTVKAAAEVTVAKDKSTDSVNVGSSAASSVHTDTPKRRQVRKAAVRACKRQISKSSDDDDKSQRRTDHTISANSAQNKKPDITEEKEEQVVEKIIQEKDKMMEEWMRMRNTTNSDLDSRLRQLNAQMIGKEKSGRKNTKRKSRRKKTASLRRKNRRSNIADDNAGNDNEELDNSNNVSVETEEIETERHSDETSTKEGIKTIKNNEVIVSIGDRKRGSRERQWEFNIKIPTPQKEKRESSSKSSNAKADRSQSEDGEEGKKIATVAKSDNGHKKQTHTRIEHERVKRTANIACLLETPFKEPSTSNEIPPTPGLFASTLNTPYSKLLPPKDVQHTTTYLFGSLTKSDLETPQLSAITPGLRFTPFGSSRDVTPRSTLPSTDYSSGGSYYKPDESEDLDRNIDRMLRDSAQKRREDEDQSQSTPTTGKNTKCQQEVKNEKEAVSAETKEEEAICVEIPAEQLKVEPIVLKRVKSFGAEGADNVDASTSNIHPHYTLASELPEICAAEEESSNSSSTFSSSSSSSSSSTNSSSSSSSSSATCANTLHEKVEHPKDLDASGSKDVEKLSLDNLSDISSTEDEEWQKLAVTEEENSQLVSNDGEVRYPVRSWLTPIKAQNSAATTERASATTIRVTLPLKSAEKRNRLEEDLRQKRERMLVKLKQDSHQRKDKQIIVAATSPSGINTALKATRKLQAMKERPKPVRQQQTKRALASTSKSSKAIEVKANDEKRPIDVLTALNLSAKKRPSNQQTIPTDTIVRAPPVAPPLGDIDDNAMSTLFVSASTQDIKVKTETIPLKNILSSAKSKQRRCVQIDALPTQKGKKKYVRKPLGFKDTIVTEPEPVKKTCTINARPTTPKPTPSIEVPKITLFDSSDNSEPDISPVPKIKIKATLGVGGTSSKLRASPRLRESKKRSTKATAKKEDNPKVKKPVDKKVLKTRLKVASPKPTKGVKQTKQRLRLRSPRAQQKSGRTEKTVSFQDLAEESVEQGNLQNHEKLDLAEATGAFKTPPKKPTTARVAATDLQKKTSKSKAKLEDADKNKASTETNIELIKKEHLTTGATDANVAVMSAAMDSVPEDIQEDKLSKPTVEKAETATSSQKPVSIRSSQNSETIISSQNSETIISSQKPETTLSSQNAEATISPQKPETTIIPHSAEVNAIRSTTKTETITSTQTIEITTNTQKAETTTSSEKAETIIGSQKAGTSTGSQKSELNESPVKPSDGSEDDPIEGCELVSITDADKTRFISLTYDGPDKAPVKAPQRQDFSNFKVVVIFDEDEQHIWRVTDDIVLLDMAPPGDVMEQAAISAAAATRPAIRNIPKKRKVRMSATSTSDEQEAVQSVDVATKNANLTASHERRQKQDSDVPMATSTPVVASSAATAQKMKTTVDAGVKARVGGTAAAESKELKAKKTTSTIAAAGSPEIQMDDIESLLSHLHGTPQ